MRVHLNLLVLILLVVSCGNPKSKTVSNRSNLPDKEIVRIQKNSEKSKAEPYVILVSIDGFRYDYAKKYNAKNLLNFEVSAKKMLPSFPSKTFPNHYAIVTGLYPGNNGLVSNSFYDPVKKQNYSIGNRSVVEDASYYKGTPLWVLASQQEMVSASMFWVGSEAPVQGVSPNYYFKYDGKVTEQERVNQTLEWLNLPEEVRPHFITLYFSITDDIGHKFGPNSPEIEEAVLQIDATIGELMDGVSKIDLPVNVIVVSDHGMLEVDTENIINPKTIIPKETIFTASFPLMVYDTNAVFIDSLYTELKKDTSRYNVYLKNNIPKQFHYNFNDERVGDLLVMPKPPYTFSSKTSLPKGASTHGYDPAVCQEMGAIFYASGPAFNKSIEIDSLENVDVYPVIAKILGLDIDSIKLDSKINVSKLILDVK